jgi:RHS repeat-associated protein
MNPSYEFNGIEFAHRPYELDKSFSGSRDSFTKMPLAASGLNRNPISRQMTTTMTDTYYVYSHDGKLMAECDHNGNGVRDYIYLGSKLIAEYNVQTGKYYYYMSDQINSTRIVTDDTGTIVHSSAHGPYGEVQKTWTNTYNPKLKFSGKEPEAYSGLDYFGARYYDHNIYRFISVDSITSKKEALSNPQLWNLYAYSRNNPITFFDPSGMADINVFIGFDRTQDRFQLHVPMNGQRIPIPVMDFSSLSNEDHNVSIQSFTTEAFKASLDADNTWTFFVGHGIWDGTNWTGIIFSDGVIADTNPFDSKFIFSTNKFIGIFACSSSESAGTFVSALNTLFSVNSGANGVTNAHTLWNAAHAVIRSLMAGGSPAEAAQSGTRMIRSIKANGDAGDHVQTQ